MTADIITIGDEILIGQVLDTNSQFIASELTKSGITIRQILSISDNEKEILDSLELSVGKVNFIILTGGLGPTNDDITKNTLLKYFGGHLVLHQETLNLITSFFTKRGKEVTDRNRSQAEVPDSCMVLLNRIGTAPGMAFTKDSTMVFSLPGVPFEMKDLLTKEVLPCINNKYILPVILHRTILIEGITESSLADTLKDWEGNLDKCIKVAYLPSPGLLRLRLSISGTNESELNNRLKKEEQYIINLIGENFVFGFDNDSLEQIIGRILTERRMTLSLAESCTGGNISQMITSVPGCSQYFKGSIIAYSNEIKSNYLDVPKETIEKYGAVSREVSECMAKGVMKLTNSDSAIAITGIAGPDGGTLEKPVGTIWISVISNNKIISGKFLFGDNRERNIVRASLSALNMLRNLLRE